MAAVKAAEDRGDPPLLRAVEAARCVQERGLGLPNVELAHVLVSNLCFANNTPELWKLLDQAMASRLVSPIHALALLTPRQVRELSSPLTVDIHFFALLVQPEAYRLYLELMNRYALSSLSVEAGFCRDKIIKSVDDALRLSDTYGVQEMDVGHAIVLFIMTIITNLIDCTIEDCGLLGSAYANGGNQLMEIDMTTNLNEKRNEHREYLRQSNALMAIEVVEKISSNRRAKVFLRLIHINIQAQRLTKNDTFRNLLEEKSVIWPEKFNGLLQRLQTVESNKSKSDKLSSINNVFDKLFMNIKRAMSRELLNKHQLLGALADPGPCSLNSCNSFGAGRDACWIPVDVFMETTMDGKHLYAISCIEVLTELTKTLQVINQASWQETFQALWVSALRLVQRDREPQEGPVPHLDARLCMLLSLVPLAILSVVKDDHDTPIPVSNSPMRSSPHGREGNNFTSRRHGLISSLKTLGQFSALLSPPPSVVNAANNAATKAAIFVSNFKAGNNNLNVGRNDTSIRAVPCRASMAAAWLVCGLRATTKPCHDLHGRCEVIAIPSQRPRSALLTRLWWLRGAPMPSRTGPWDSFVDGGHATPPRQPWNEHDASETAMGRARRLRDGRGTRTMPQRRPRGAHDASAAAAGCARRLHDGHGACTMPL
ncbi:hypothetical protein ZIOFF_033319 [Zingiber officinale]|uniref:Uncharacterized protein n=1 Tax=Zingiber officinale TaxID=94328 RepID=A0A8J5L1Q9_ZINOF|nr:hypothetical protein ZIOFF_033319 [Zingiber officinale]